MEFKKGYYYYGMWFAGVTLPFGEGDVMGTMYRKGKKTEESAEWTIEWRVRWYRDSKTRLSKDKKQWFKATLNMPLEQASRKFVGTLGSMPGIKESPDFFLLDGDYKKALEEIQSHPPKWMHIQIMKPIPEETPNNSSK